MQVLWGFGHIRKQSKQLLSPLPDKMLLNFKPFSLVLTEWVYEQYSCTQSSYITFFCKLGKSEAEALVWGNSDQSLKKYVVYNWNSHLKMAINHQKMRSAVTGQQHQWMIKMHSPWVCPCGRNSKFLVLYQSAEAFDACHLAEEEKKG